MDPPPLDAFMLGSDAFDKDLLYPSRIYELTRKKAWVSFNG